MEGNYKYVCLGCGSEFENPELVEESVGSFWGVSCSETIEICPHCEDYRIKKLEEMR